LKISAYEFIYFCKLVPIFQNMQMGPPIFHILN